MRTVAISLVAALLAATALAADGNRLAYLDEPCDPYYVHRDFPKLITPQWVGEEGVEAVVTLAIDDMRDPAKYEAFLRPILNRLKQIDGRAPVSIMTCSVKPDDPQLAAWLQEGLSIECHTVDHPCPLLAGGDFAKAKSTYDRCVDLMASIPGNKPVAFRVPCCDSQNTPSPRFWSEIFNGRTEKGNFLSLDSSVFCILTPKDKTLPREITTNERGEERFRRYLPFPSFVNTIEDYPYPYVIGGLCWEFPCIVPSDWEAQNIQRPNNPDTVGDLKLALDAVVLKQGVMNLVYHPHGWIRAEQIVELIDHAVAKHGKKVKFLTFRECHQRLNKHLLAGEALRNQRGQDMGVRLLDVDHNGYLDVVIGNERKHVTRLWQPAEKTWKETSFPALVDVGLHFGVLDGKSQRAAAVQITGRAWQFDGAAWAELPPLPKFDLSYSIRMSRVGDDLESILPKLKETGLRLRDFDGDGVCELVVGGQVYAWQPASRSWTTAFILPTPLALLDDSGANAVFRLLDVNGDGRLDFLFADTGNYILVLFRSLKEGFGNEWVNHKHGDGQVDTMPPLAVDGRNFGCWVHSGQLWWQNEQTSKLPDLVDRRSLASLVTPVKKDEPKQPAKELEGAGVIPLAPIGAARIDITPTFPIRLTGYGSRTKESEGVAQKLFAKALAIGGDVEIGTRNAECCSGNGASGEKTIVPDGAAILITVDNCGVCAPIVDAVRKQLAAKAGIAPERIAICSSHTHCAPMVNGFAPMIFGPPPPAEHQKHIDDYTAELTDKLVRVGLFALAARRPGRLAWATGKVGFAKNRRALQQGKWSGFGEVDEGPVDRRLQLLVARDEQDKLIALLANYACHCTTLGGDFNQLHGDWAGVAQERIEAAHPDAVAMISIGAGADANPSPRGTLALVNQHGQALADEVTRLLGPGVAMQPLDASKLACKLQSIELPFAPLPTQDEYAARAKQPGAPGYHAKFFHDKLASGEKLPTTLPYSVATWNFGDDLAMVYLAGEVVVDYSIRLHTVAKSDRLWVTAYANDVPCYIASKRVLMEGGYEADQSMIYYGRPTRLAPETEDKIIAAVKAQLPPQFLAVPAADKPSLPDKPAANQGANDFPPPLSPEGALKSIHVRPGLRVELVACEPLVVDPVAFDWGPDGRLWVVEMRDYPLGMDGKGKPGGRVKVLTDTDNDGRYDEAKLFLDDIPYPTGVKVWRKGILVSAAPLIFYAEDTDSDGKADVKKTLYEGFGEGNQQHRVNGLRWGFDGWLYAGNGDSGGKIKPLLTGAIVDVSGRDLRIRPDTGEIETQSGQTQYGRCRDDWGNWFGGNNSNPLWHYVLDDHYLRRNPRLAPPSVRRDVPEVPGASRVYPRSRTMERFNNPGSENHFTSACSPEIYRDTWLGDEYYGNSFVCEPVHNLIHREIVSPAGFSFTSRRADDEKQSEFLASEDSWFRPAMIRTGPDGALWVADMYRFVIEHPQWIPADWQARLNLRAGEDGGGIYRIVRADGQSPVVPRLDNLDAAQLVARLDSTNGALRDMVQQLLAWKADKSAEVPVVKVLQLSKLPAARLQALGTLDTLGVLHAGHVQLGLRDEHPGVQVHALRLAERFVGKSPQVVPDLLKLADSTQPQVKLQIAYLIGQWEDWRGAVLLARFLTRKPTSPYLNAASFSSLRKDNAADVLSDILSTTKTPISDPLIDQLIAFNAAAGNTNWVTDVIARHVSALQKGDPEVFASAARLIELLNRHKVMVGNNEALALAEFPRQARSLLASPLPSPAVARLGATAHLGHDPKEIDRDIDLLYKLLSPKNPPELQLAAIEVLAMRIGTADAYRGILMRWPQLSPALRSVSLDHMLARETGVTVMLGLIQRRAIALDLDARQREQLAAIKDDALRAMAQKLFDVAPNADRAAVVAQYQTVLAMKGDAKRGMAVFAKRCAQCHRFFGVGHLVGPEIASIKDRSPQSLLVALLDPNRAVEDRYRDYSATTSDGRVFSGIIEEETTTSLTLLGPESKSKSLLRADLESLRATGRSLMPEGLEKDVPPAEMADLFAYIATSPPPPKQFPGNAPALVRPAADGTLTLAATTARITGPKIIFEQQYQNLGWWSSPDDAASWTVDLPAAGRYRVTLDFACDRTTAGNTLVVQCGEQKLVFKVPSTGTWDDYQQQEIGVLDLPAGQSDVAVRAAGELKGALIDLRGVRVEAVK